MSMLTGVAVIAFSSYSVADPPHPTQLATYSGDSNKVLSCDTLEQIRTIVAAPDHRAQYLKLYRHLNAGGARVCEFLNTSGYVRSVTPLGPMMTDGKRFFAWAVELGTNQPGYSFFVLYIEARSGA